MLKSQSSSKLSITGHLREVSAMEGIERMVALKKAYAEMILNTSKEAAARVMAAERRAKRFQQDLLSTKEEALRMLLRMKQIINAKTSEAEITSLNQKRKISELEAQLDEAEELIIDLRAKLCQVQDHLDDVKTKYIHTLRHTEMAVVPCQNRIFESEKNYRSPIKSFSQLETVAVTSDVLASTSEHSSLDNEETARPKIESDQLPMREPAFASVTTNNKEAELSKEKCIQRIHATETGVVDVKLHSAHDVICLLENKLAVRRKGQNEVIDSLPVPRTDRLGGSGISTEEAAFRDKPANDQPVKLQMMCRRRTRYRKTKATSCKYQPGRIVKSRRTSFAISSCKNYLCLRDNHEVDYTPGLEEELHPTKHQTVSVIGRSIKKRKIKHSDGLTTSRKLNDDHSCHYDEFHTDKTVKYEQKARNNLLKEDGGELEEGNCVKAISANANVTTCTNSWEGSIPGGVAEKDTRKVNKSISYKHDGLMSQLELRNASVSSDMRDMEISDRSEKAPSQPDRMMPLKYTFSRKSKMGAFINPLENSSFQESSMMKSSGEETDNVLAPENSCVNESSRDGRRVAQVARQLISLSGKRWW